MLVLIRPPGPSVLHQGNDPGSFSKVQGIPFQSQLAARLLDQACLVLGVVDREIGPVAENRSLFPQDVRPQGVESADGEPGKLPGNEGPNPLRHLPGRLVRESHREDLRLWDAFGQKVGDAIRDDPGLSRACAGQDKDRAVHPMHRLGLLFVQETGKIAQIVPLQSV